MSPILRLGILALVALNGLFPGAPYAQELAPCVQNKLVGSAAGALTITEYSATRIDPDACPHGLDLLGTKFVLQRSKLFVWFRLEGDATYLELPQASMPIKVKVRKENDDFSINDFLDIKHGSIDVDAARAETDISTPKHFDWRFDIQFSTIPSPGTYNIWLTQGDTSICLTDSNCTASIEIDDK